VLSIGGMTCNNLGQASRNLKTQLPLIATTFPEVEPAHRGTINIRLDQGLIVSNPDHCTPRLDWHPAHSPGEVFHFLRIRFEHPIGSTPIAAWLYLPQNSPHRKDVCLHGVLGPWIAIGKAPQKALIHIDRPSLGSKGSPLAIIV
jgi:hypothetical protein